MGDNKNTNDQEDISANADFSTQSNESHHLSLALNSTQVEPEFILNIIEGLKSQKRFKDVSYVKVKQDSVSLKAFDISFNSTVFIKVKKYQNSHFTYEKLEFLKQFSHKNPQFIVQIIDFWRLEQDQYGLLFQEIEYLPQNIIEFLNEGISLNQNILEQQKAEIIIQIIQTIQLSEKISNGVNLKLNLQYYLINDYKPKLLLKVIESEKIIDDEKIEQNLNDNLKNRLVAMIECQYQRLNNTQVVGIFILLISNWQNFCNQYINNIDELTLTDYILKGEIENLVSVDKSTIYYQLYQKIMNQSSLNTKSHIDLQALINLLQKNNTYEQTQFDNTVSKKEQKKKDIYDDSEDDNGDDIEQSEINTYNNNHKNQNKNIKLQILNPNVIINKYISSISNCQLPLKQQNLDNNQSNQPEKNQSLVKNDKAENDLNNSEKAKEADVKQINQEEKVIEMEDLNQNKIVQNLQTSYKFVSQNNSKVIQLNNNQSQVEKVIVLEDFEKTPAQSNLFVSQKIDLKNTSNVVYLSNQKENQQDKPLVVDLQETPQNTKRVSESNQNQSKIIEFSNKKENEENKIDISYNHNNDIVLEMKEVDGYGINNASQQKNINNSDEAQNPLNSYQRYLFELGVECEDISEIFIMEYNEQNGCCPSQLNCVQAISYIKLKLFCINNPLLGKKLLDHIFLWFVKVVNLIIMLLLVTLYLCILLVILILVHAIYYATLISLGVLLIPFGLTRYFIRIYYQLTDFKSSIIYQRQNSYTWFEYDSNYSTAREFKNFCHKMMHRRYQYLQSPSKNMASF
ncbi:transmembrane protein, putative (macronuclear) [Tetrahymena thermophila SB210]|uniref:Transmembrane protein, putative n=1 Tax=Tetrahymena thermophila (strain SB210) TaxID=312017 RepID=Q23KG4_TETTS|nr:transmembrane protein, putative [Tetrahymena thermophila SB210]EAR96879.2 transmembrane protein, putative [Tetrahymena thermophila SB210]|eukprot:XP_001017124.2 transmembrane protein, putative [Tetrahymena thermophila SB210]